MSLLEIKNMLDTLNIDVAYDHFNKKVNPPFVAYRELSPDTFKADDYNYLNFNSYEIELCTIKKDIELESLIETLFFNNKIPFEKDEIWDDLEKIYHIIYTI